MMRVVSGDVIEHLSQSRVNLRNAATHPFATYPSMSDADQTRSEGSVT